uniref:DM domain-containing protein n=1 Tax=Branchiostoma floridae TaxID=7739 RepID=C3ZUL1_BRAFL|eukprot:XP_002587712.1 hypothetical protein BRAFLDRAFT_94615 [Branchiostoma floridae]
MERKEYHCKKCRVHGVKVPQGKCPWEKCGCDGCLQVVSYRRQHIPNDEIADTSFIISQDKDDKDSYTPSATVANDEIAGKSSTISQDKDDNDSYKPSAAVAKESGRGAVRKPWIALAKVCCLTVTRAGTVRMPWLLAFLNNILRLSQPTSGQVQPMMDKLRNHLCTHDAIDTEFTKKIKRVIWEDLKTRYQDLEVTNFFEEAIAFDSRFKTQTPEEVWASSLPTPHPIGTSSLRML